MCITDRNRLGGSVFPGEFSRQFAKNSPGKCGWAPSISRGGVAQMESPISRGIPRGITSLPFPGDSPGNGFRGKWIPRRTPWQFSWKWQQWNFPGNPPGNADGEAKVPSEFPGEITGWAAKFHGVSPGCHFP